MATIVIVLYRFKYADFDKILIYPRIDSETRLPIGRSLYRRFVHTTQIYFRKKNNIYAVGVAREATSCPY